MNAKAREAFEATHTELVRLLDEEGSYADPETRYCYEQFLMGWQTSRNQALHDVRELFPSDNGTITYNGVRLMINELIHEQW